MPVIIEGFKAEEFGKSLMKKIQAFTVATAERALQEQGARGFDREPVVVTDGVRGRDWAQVKFGGKIEFLRRGNMTDAVIWALEQVSRLSPVRSGRYRKAHIVMINGVQIVGNYAAALDSVKETDRVQIVNPMPYAKKIEGRAGSKKRGISAMRGLSSQAPGGVYRVVQRQLVQRYGRAMFFDFKYVKLDNGATVRGFAGGNRRKSATLRALFGNRTQRRKIERAAVYPALQFFIKPTSLPN